MNEFSISSAGLPDRGHAVWADAAFGARPGLTAAEAPPVGSAVDAWLRAVVLGGQGRYAAARAQLGRVRRSAREPVLVSLAISTEASLLRQLGWHASASALDGRALALVLPELSRSGDRVDSNGAEAVCDALTGLAADALGTARPTLSVRLLERCRDFLGESPQRWRSRLRWHWVAAETALAAPALVDAPALAHAEAAVELADAAPSVRHRVKSRLLLAAAAAAAGAPGRSLTLAAEVAEETREHDLLPLRWACAMLRSGVAAGPVAGVAAAEAAQLVAALAGRGGLLRSENTVLGEA
ncbi:hypothetical protein NDR87_19185 [Nocardia sp. CDC159]|uniref:Uncharacterized protein n=1 Tax=Nocardia pulmonis TaxID=2951408 RepID=A0A9X2IZM4_9NOCA|nr:MULTISPECIES: hypothetical protein [Nocardia]MCM6776185.1 hypothetical protein [Nocardia pulmonis]MCM6788489.1 hypothetical protein [Nocardia sp. CDC159]